MYAQWVARVAAHETEAKEIQPEINIIEWGLAGDIGMGIGLAIILVAGSLTLLHIHRKK